MDQKLKIICIEDTSIEEDKTPITAEELKTHDVEEVLVMGKNPHIENPPHYERLHSERLHSELGGSTAHRWLNCPGSVFLARTVPTPKTSEAAAEGTLAHEIAEALLEGFLMFKLNGDASLYPADTRAYDPVMVEHINSYVEAVWENILEQSITNKAWGLEEKFEINEKLGMFGSIDFWAIYLDDRGHRVGAVCDFKYGFGYVDHKKNAQLAFYAVALRNFARSKGKDLDEVRAVIYQPRCLQGDPYREVKFTAKQLANWEEKFLKVAHQVLVAKKESYKTGDWCKWCPAQAVCPKYQEVLKKETELDLVKLDEVTLPEPRKMTDEQLKKIIIYQSDLIAFVHACVAYGVNRHITGQPLPGMKLVGSKPRRIWKDNQDEIAEELKKLGLKEPYNLKLKGIGEVEKKLGKGKIDSFLTTSAVKPILVEDSDDRQALATEMLKLLDVTDEK